MQRVTEYVYAEELSVGVLKERRSKCGAEIVVTLSRHLELESGRERILRAYEEAVREQYRFYSYGDAMFIE